MVRWAMILGAGVLASGCDTGCDPEADLDADGIDDCAELELGTSPELADTDGDGDADGIELGCVSDPLDSEQACYVCGWPHHDEIVSDQIGPEIGDTLRNIVMPDQCGERVSLHDFAGAYRILFMTTQWCGACLAEAKELRTLSKQFERRTSIPFSYIIAVFEDIASGPPGRQVAEEYAEAADARQVVPVLADRNQDVLVDTPYQGDALPGRCVLTPQMEILDCYTGASDDAEAYALIEQHAADNPSGF